MPAGATGLRYCRGVRQYAALFAVGLVGYGLVAWDRVARPSSDPHFVVQADAWLHGQAAIAPPLVGDDWAQVETVALPIEQQVNGVENMLYMQSTCTSDGRYTLTITFKVGTDLNFALVLVQNRVSAAVAQLPPAVQQQGVVMKKKSTAILQIITLTSPDAGYDALLIDSFRWSGPGSAGCWIGKPRS